MSYSFFSYGDIEANWWLWSGERFVGWTALFERRMQIFLHIHQWREDNEGLDLEHTISDTWTPQQREAFLQDWFDDLPHGEKRACDEMMDGEVSTSQTGRGENERPYAIEDVKEINIKKFRTKGLSYTPGSV